MFCKKILVIFIICAIMITNKEILVKNAERGLLWIISKKRSRKIIFIRVEF